MPISVAGSTRNVSERKSMCARCGIVMATAARRRSVRTGEGEAGLRMARMREGRWPETLLRMTVRAIVRIRSGKLTPMIVFVAVRAFLMKYTIRCRHRAPACLVALFAADCGMPAHKFETRHVMVERAARNSAPAFRGMTRLARLLGKLPTMRGCVARRAIGKRTRREQHRAECIRRPQLCMARSTLYCSVLSDEGEGCCCMIEPLCR